MNSNKFDLDKVLLVISKDFEKKCGKEKNNNKCQLIKESFDIKQYWSSTFNIYSLFFDILSFIQMLNILKRYSTAHKNINSKKENKSMDKSEDNGDIFAKILCNF